MDDYDSDVSYDDDDDYEQTSPSPKRKSLRKKSQKSPQKGSPVNISDELNVKEFDLPTVESLNKLSKVQIADFALQHTTPELLLSCLTSDKNVKESENAIRALDEINEKVEDTGAIEEGDESIADMLKEMSIKSPKKKKSPKKQAVIIQSPKRKPKSPEMGAIGAGAAEGPIVSPSRGINVNDLIVLYKEKVAEKKEFTKALLKEEDKDIKLMIKDEIEKLKGAINDIEIELKKHGKNPNLLAFGLGISRRTSLYRKRKLVSLRRKHRLSRKK